MVAGRGVSRVASRWVWLIERRAGVDSVAGLTRGRLRRPYLAAGDGGDGSDRSGGGAAGCRRVTPRLTPSRMIERSVVGVRWFFFGRCLLTFYTAGRDPNVRSGQLFAAPSRLGAADFSPAAATAMCGPTGTSPGQRPARHVYLGRRPLVSGSPSVFMVAGRGSLFGEVLRAAAARICVGKEIDPKKLTQRS